MFYKFRVIVIIFAIGLLAVNQSYAGGFVAEVLRFKVDEGYAEIRAGRFWSSLLPSNLGDEFEVSVRVHNKIYDDVDVLLCSEREFTFFKAGRQARCAGVNRGKRKFSFRASVRTPERHYLVINNSFSLMVKKKVSYTVIVRNRPDAGKRRALEESLSKISTGITKMFEVPEFDLRIAPCGTENAYSEDRTGNITICSELFVELLMKRQNGAISAITFHEIGHSLLILWGLPGYDNEETVDEFALVMLYLAGKQEHAIDWMEWFEKNDPRAEAQARIYNDVRHPLSVQRIRNIRRILRDPSPVIERWNRLLYPKMTVAGLREVINSSPRYADRELANRLIAEKDGRQPSQKTQYSTIRTPPPPPTWSNPPPE